MYNCFINDVDWIPFRLFVRCSKGPEELKAFHVTVPSQARQKLEFSLIYEELLERRLGKYEHVINIDPGQVVRDFTVDVDIAEAREITLLRVPPLRQNMTEITDPHSGRWQQWIEWVKFNVPT